MDKETFDRTADHLSKSLDNAQNTIRFIDTKVGVVVSVSWSQVLSLLILSLATAAIVLFALGLRAAWKTS